MSQVQAVKEATDIVAVIGSRVVLQRSGTYHKGLCPFHSEKSPSFFVNEALQRYKCFGCGESGDVFTFLEKYEGMTFHEALQHLADAADISLEPYKKTGDDELREQLLTVLNLAKEYYHYLLVEHKTGQPAREYLKHRGVSSESIRLFQLGYALPQWDGLLTYLHKKKRYSLTLLEQAGLIIKGAGGRYYDRFRDRVMFPLKDHRGRVVGFSGRVLDSQAKEAKYINSPETLLYHKSKLLFGYSELFQHIRKARTVIVVEGEFDVVTSAQAHVNTIVAIKGSALTEDHAKLLARVADTVLLALDTDAAGVEATKKSIAVLKQTKVELRVLQIPEGKDPDELIRKDPRLWRQVVKTSVTAHDFLIRAALQRFDATTPTGKRKILEELAPVLIEITHAVEKEHYIKSLAEKMGSSVEHVRSDIENYQKNQRFVAHDQSAAKAEKTKTLTPRESQEHYCLYLLFNAPDKLLRTRAREIADVSFTTPGVAQIITLLSESDEKVTLATFAGSLPEDLKQLIFDLEANRAFIHLAIDPADQVEWHRAVQKLQQLAISDRINQITEQLAQLDDKTEKTSQEETLQNTLLTEIVLLRRKLA